MDFKLQQFNVPMTVTALANIHYFEFTNEFHSQENYHNFCELLYVDNGEIEVKSENFEGCLRENQLIIHRPNEKHSLRASGTAAPNVIVIGFECNSDELFSFSGSPVTLGTEHKKMLSKIMQEGMSIYEPPYDIPNTIYMKKREKAPFGTDQMIKISLEAFLIILVRDFLGDQKTSQTNTSGAVSYIANVHQYITEHYTEKIYLENLCFIFGTNRTTLCREFKDSYGKTIVEYIHYLKIKSAKQMLRDKNMSVTEISEKLGFDSVHYFCRLFKKTTGFSPTDYANSIKSKLSL